MPQSDEVIAKSPFSRTLPAFTDSVVEPFSRLRSEVDRLFDDFPVRWPQFSRLTSGLLVPAVEMTETPKTYKISIEVPGMDAAEIDMHVHDGAILISGEKKAERDEEEKGYSYSERSYGSFQRRIELPAGTDPQGIKAKVRNGVLLVTLPKKPGEAGKKQRISIEAA